MEVMNARTLVGIIGGILTVAVLGLFLVIRNGMNSSLQVSDLEAIGNAMILAYENVGYNYGSGTIASSSLISTGMVPSGAISGTALQSRFNTPMTVTGNGSSYTIALTGVPTANCVSIMTDPGLAQYLASVTVVGGTARTPPVPFTTASGDCAAASTESLDLTYTGHP
jgi:hypothetical protein